MNASEKVVPNNGDLPQLDLPNKTIDLYRSPMWHAYDYVLYASLQTSLGCHSVAALYINMIKEMMKKR